MMQFFKYIQHISIGLFVSFGAYAGTMGASEDSSMIQNGFYIAGNVGLGNLFNHESHSFNSETHQLGASGILGGGFIGYDYWLTQRASIGLEFFADATALNTSVSHPPNTYAMNQSYDLGVRILPELMLSDALNAHVFLGYVNGNFIISDNGVYGTVSDNFNVNGFQTGAGLTTALTQNLLVRLDGLYNIYATETTPGHALVPGIQQKYSNAFNVLIAELSVLYKF
jgi:opacity protein-like surface antigen